MLWYVLKLLVLLPLIGLLAWGSLKFAQKMQAKVTGAPGSKSVRKPRPSGCCSRGPKGSRNATSGYPISCGDPAD